MIAVNKYQTVSIGEASRLTGASIKQIRHWADIGIIEPPDRVQCENGHIGNTARWIWKQLNQSRLIWTRGIRFKLRPGKQQNQGGNQNEKQKQ